MSLNKSTIWTPADLQDAFYKVGGQNSEMHLTEPKEVAKRIAKNFSKETTTVIELGCGFGRIAKELYELTKLHIIGVDFNKPMLDMASEYTVDLPIEYHLMTDSSIPLPDNCADFVFSHAVMIHNDKQGIYKLFSESKRILKNGGGMYHDFLNGDNSEAVQSSKNAIKVNFPFYAHTFKEIKFLARRHGFQISTSVNPDKVRIDHLFIKE